MKYVITLSCPDRLGLVRAVSAWLFDQDCNILESDQLREESTVRFFMRVQFEGDVSLDRLVKTFAPVAGEFDMTFEIWPLNKKVKVLVMVSRLDHCLVDLLYRARTGELPVEINLIVSNHQKAERLAQSESIDFLHLPITPETKQAQEAKLLQEIERRNIDLVVLARYMQILTPELCRGLEGRIINIHHSFLPGFKGARPYHQAFDRGVKLIGATAHYVTEELDEGPIIEQSVERVDHGHDPADLAEVGRDIERVVLSKAVRFHAEHRVLLNGKRTVVFT